MKVTEIEVHRITPEYEDWIAYQMNHYSGPASRTIYVVHTDDGRVGLGEGGRPNRRRLSISTSAPIPSNGSGTKPHSLWGQPCTT